MGFIHKNKTLLILLAIIVVTTSVALVCLRSIQYDRTKVAEAQTYIGVGSCQNTSTRSGGNCGSGCGQYDSTGATMLWRAYNVIQVTTTYGNRYYQFTFLSDVCSLGDKYDSSNPPDLIAGRCDCNIGGPYSICCNGSTPVNFNSGRRRAMKSKRRAWPYRSPENSSR